jgi:hypothetical protein
VRVRVAHGRLIHGKYGAIAPESCTNCRKRGTTCLVYHPGLKDTGRTLGKMCDECRNRSVQCDFDPKTWGKILEPVSAVVVSEEDHRPHMSAQEDDADDDAQYGALPEVDSITRHPQSQAIQAGEIPDSDEPDMKTEGEDEDAEFPDVEYEDETQYPHEYDDVVYEDETHYPQEDYVDEDDEQGALTAENKSKFFDEYISSNGMQDVAAETNPGHQQTPLEGQLYYYST